MARSRRALLAALTAVVAGCGSNPASTTTVSQTRTPEPTESPTPSPTSTATPDSAPERVELDDDRVRWRIVFPADGVAGLTATTEGLYVGTGVDPTPTPKPGETAGKGYLTGVSVPDGELRFHRELPAPVTGGPYVRDGSAYLALGYSNGYDGRDQRLARYGPDGTPRWESAERDSFLRLYGFDGDSAYLGTGDDHLQPTGETTFAVDLETGAERWAVEGGDAYGGRVAEETLYADYAGVAIAAIATADGSASWRRNIEALHATERSFPTAAGNLFAAVEEDGDHGIAAIDAADGSTVWTHGLDAADPFVVDSATAVGESVVGTEFGGLLFARDAATGQARWERPFENRTTAPLVGDGTLYCSVLDGPVVAVDAASGGTVWRARGGSGFETLSLVDGTVLVVHSGEGETVVAARRLSDGGLRWRRTVPARLNSVTQAGGTLVVATENQSVYGIAL